MISTRLVKIFRVVRLAAVFALAPGSARAQVLDLTVHDIGIALGDKPRMTGLRINCRDRALREINGVNVTIWSPYEPPMGVVNGLALGIPVTGARIVNGALVGVLGGGVAGSINGIGIGGLGVGAGGDGNGILVGLIGVGVGGHMTGLSVGGIGVGSGSTIRGIQFGGIGVGSGGDLSGISVGVVGVGAAGKVSGLAIGGVGVGGGGDFEGVGIGGVGVGAGGNMTGLMIGGARRRRRRKDHGPQSGAGVESAPHNSRESP